MELATFLKLRDPINKKKKYKNPFNNINKVQERSELLII